MLLGSGGNSTFNYVIYIELWILYAHGAKTEPNPFICTIFTDLYVWMGAQLYPHQICAKTVFQCEISAKMPYVSMWRQNRDVCGCYMGDKRAFYIFCHKAGFSNFEVLKAGHLVTRGSK